MPLAEAWQMQALADFRMPQDRADSTLAVACGLGRASARPALPTNAQTDRVREICNVLATEHAIVRVGNQECGEVAERLKAAVC